MLYVLVWNSRAAANERPDFEMKFMEGGGREAPKRGSRWKQKGVKKIW